MKHVETHKFKRGQKVHLDTIYPFSGIGDDVVGQWWEHENGDGLSDELIITKDITIRIEIRTPSSLLCDKAHTQAPDRGGKEAT